MSAGKFFVTGLPRSRTAWMAAFLSTGESLCMHEPSYKMSSIEDLRPILDSTFYKYIGVSDSGLGYFAPWIIENLQCRMLVIERDFPDVADSLVKLGFDLRYIHDYCNALMGPLLAVKAHPLVKWVHFNSLVHKRVMQDIYWWLMPGMAFDEARWTEFANFHIEVDLKRTIDKTLKNQSNFDKLYADLHRKIRREHAPA